MIKAIVFDLWNTLGKKEGSLSKRLMEHFSIPRTQDHLERYEMAIQLKRWSTKEEMACAFLTAFNLPTTQDAIVFIISTQEHTLDH